MNENNSDNRKPGGSWKPLVVMLIISVVLTLLFWGTLQRYKQGTVEEIKSNMKRRGIPRMHGG